MQERTLFNPLEVNNLVKTLVNEFNNTPLEQLSSMKPFRGVGIYSLYYRGPFAAYQPIAKSTQLSQLFGEPIYVGVSPPIEDDDSNTPVKLIHEYSLFDRIEIDKKSIQQTGNINLSDFLCRYIVTHDIWIPLGERMLINKYKPVWNVCVDGFGNHDPGSGRHKQKMSPWDCLHPGRPWATKLQSWDESVDEILLRIEKHWEDRQHE